MHAQLLVLSQAPPAFGRTVFPLCEEFLDESKHQVVLELLESGEQVGFRSVMDFVLCSVLPQFLPACVAFYEGVGSGMTEAYSQTQIQRVDRFMLRVLRNAYRLLDEAG